MEGRHDASSITGGFGGCGPLVGADFASGKSQYNSQVGSLGFIDDAGSNEFGCSG
jgi:hypothetical protein